MEIKKKNKTLREIFIYSVSFTGGDRLVSRSKTRRHIWLILIVLAVVALTFHLYTVVENYQEYSVNTVIRNYLFSFWFPDVTICLSLPFSYKKHPTNWTGLKNAKRFWNYAMKYDDSLISQRKSYNKAWCSFQKFAYEEDIYTSIINSIQYCFYMGKPCFKDKFKITRHPLRLNCVTFKPPKRRFTIPDKEAGLHLIFGTEESYTFFNALNHLQKIHGYEVIIHEPDTQPPVQKDVALLTAGSHTTIKLKMQKFVKANTPISPCYTKDDLIKSFKEQFKKHVNEAEIKALKFEGQYSEDDCMNLFTQNQSLSDCNCLQDRVPFPWGITLNKKGCHAISSEFFFNEGIDSNGILRYKNTTIDLEKSDEFKQIVNRSKCSENIADYITDYDKLQADMEKCPERCVKREYVQHITSSKWPASEDHLYTTLTAYHASENTFNPNISIDLNATFKYLSSLLIYPSDLNLLVTTETLAYPWYQVLADFGGNMGLWINCSILTIIEVIDFFVRAGSQKMDNKDNLWKAKKKKVNSNEEEFDDECKHPSVDDKTLEHEKE